VSVFLISALRAIVEMLGLCLIGQGVLYLMAGQKRHENAVYTLLSLLTRPVRRSIALVFRRSPSSVLVVAITFLALFSVWIGLAIMRKFI
jgi:hypothetical protein